jgi:hypothetical protein
MIFIILLEAESVNARNCEGLQLSIRAAEDKLE